MLLPVLLFSCFNMNYNICNKVIKRRTLSMLINIKRQKTPYYTEIHYLHYIKC